MTPSPTTRRRIVVALRTALGLAAALLILTAVLLSPALMRPLLGTGDDWQRLGAVGETYGGVSAVASGIALIGVTASLVLQRRQSRVEREYAFREYHREMIKMSMDNPAYAVCWGPFQRDTGLDTNVNFYVTLMLGYWHAGWAVGAFNEVRMRMALRQFFAGSVGRACWRVQGKRRMAGRGRHSRRFFRMVDEEYRRAVAAGPPQVVQVVGPSGTPPAADAPPPTRRTGRGPVAALAAGGLLAGAAIGWLAATRGRR